MAHLSDYMLNCFSAWCQGSSIELHVVRRKVDTAEAPFDFGPARGGMTSYDREEMSDDDVDALSRRLQPNLIICFGWSDRAYLAAVKARAADTAAVLTMDNQWAGSIRQFLGILCCRLSLVHFFDFVWVPGARQKRFARLLGFPTEKIREGFYVANEANFTPIFRSILGAPKKRLIFVGRYVDVKGIRELWRAFETYHATRSSQLELLCIGTGPLYPDRPSHPRITHLGFVQPKDFREKLVGGGIFVLPSRFEPWGVVVHEFALAGFPLLLSNAVGAADRFLSLENGRFISPDRPESLLEAFAYVDGLDDRKLKEMSENSRLLGEGLTVADWCAQADEFMRAARS